MTLKHIVSTIFQNKSSAVLTLLATIIFFNKFTTILAIIGEKALPKVATFHFPEYAYKETSKNEITYHEFQVACEQHNACENLEGVLKKACVRRCISYSCYQDIYAFDELEEGEIDVRLNSFKGCVIQRTGNRMQHKESFLHLLNEMQWKFSIWMKYFV